MRRNSVHDVVHIDALKEIMALALVSVCAIPKQVHLDYLFFSTSSEKNENKIEGLCLEIKLHHGRGEVPFPFRRAPGGLAMRRYRVRFHHAAAAAQSYRRSYELPASLANNGQRDALATTSSVRHRDFV